MALPKTGDKVTLSAEYWDSCCGEEYDASVAGPLRLGDVGEVGGRNECVYIYMRVCVCMCICVYMYAFVCMYVYMCVYIYICTHISGVVL